jgi:hypothetical protein
MGKGGRRNRGKGKNNNGRSSNHTPPKVDPKVEPKKDMTPTAKVEQAEQTAKKAGLEPKPSATAPKEDIEALGKRLLGVIEAYEAAKKATGEAETKALKEMEEAEASHTAADELCKQLEAQQTELDRKAEEADQRQQELESEHTKLAKDRKALEKDREKLVTATEAITQREIDADAGFVKRRQDALKELDKAHKALLKKNEDLAKKLETARQEHMEGLQQREEDHRNRLEARESDAEQKLQDRIAALNHRESALNEQQAQLQKAEQRLQLQQQELDILKDDIQEFIDEKAANAVAAVQAELDAEKSRADVLRGRIQELEDSLAELRRANRELGNQSPEAIKAQLDEQEATIRRLLQEKANLPTEAEAEELTQLRKDRDTWQTERRTLRAELQRVKRQLETQTIAVDENRALNDLNKALESNQKILRAALDDLRHDVEERLDKHRDQPVFPQLKNMDEDQKLQESTGRLYRGPSGGFDLARFSSDLRYRICKQEDAPDLYYKEQDIRAFLGGLAMSRLHLLQGISGIGKSSLPRRFATAVGGFCDTVSVQAGWRDRNDLLGYFNAFERRYYESGFVQALYKAQTAHWEDRVAIVLLDEMNLSHPEQYGADMLDVLERTDSKERRFELMSAKQKGETPKAIQEGRFLPLPKNVWFVGTANHDETTKDFADKTYDRSFVMELPGRPKPHRLESYRDRSPLSYTALMEAFEAAANNHNHQEEVARLWTWLDDKLRAPLDDHFGIGFGGRLEAQTQRFVPVVLACGGTPGEALDHLVTTRLLRRLRGRHDLMADEVRGLLDIVQQTWPCKKSSATAGAKLLQRELKRLGVEQ